MAKRRKKKTVRRKTKSVSIPKNVRRAKGVISKYISRLQREESKQKNVLSKTQNEIRSLKSMC
jgi:hypothetical protein